MYSPNQGYTNFLLGGVKAISGGGNYATGLGTGIEGDQRLSSLLKLIKGTYSRFQFLEPTENDIMTMEHYLPASWPSGAEATDIQYDFIDTVLSTVFKLSLIDSLSLIGDQVAEVIQSIRYGFTATCFGRTALKKKQDMLSGTIDPTLLENINTMIPKENESLFIK